MLSSDSEGQITAAEEQRQREHYVFNLEGILYSYRFLFSKETLMTDKIYITL